MVFGPQTLHRLPEMLQQVRGQRRAVVDISFPEIEKFDHLPAPRADGATAFVSIMEGCSKYCSFLRRALYPRRGDQPALRRCRRGSRAPGRAGRARRSICLARTSTRIAARWTTAPVRSRHLIRFVAPIDGDRTDPLHHIAPGRVFRQSLIEAYADVPELANLPASAGAERFRPDPGDDEARSYRARVQTEDPPAARSAAGHQHVVGFHRRFPGRDRARFRATMDLIAEIGFDQSFSFIYSRRPGTPAASLPDDVITRQATAPGVAAGADQSASHGHQP